MDGERAPENPDAEALTYAGYLRLDRLLDAQRPLTAEHDELLFIVQHQAVELLLSLLRHEIAGAVAGLARGDLPQANRLLARAGLLLEQINGCWRLLRGLDPGAFARLRPRLGAASGLQSANWRALEALLGEPAAPADTLAGAVARLLPAGEAEARWRAAYGAPSAEPALRELGERLLDLEDGLASWHREHLAVVERLVGALPGTGGTAGAAYLRARAPATRFPALRRARLAP